MIALPLAKLTERQERVTLSVLRVVGYLNLFGLVALLLSMKGLALNQRLLAVTPLVAVCGSLFYYLAWKHAVSHVSKGDGRSYMRPYLIGAYLLVASVALFVLLYLIK